MKSTLSVYVYNLKLFRSFVGVWALTAYMGNGSTVHYIGFSKK